MRRLLHVLCYCVLFICGSSNTQQEHSVAKRSLLFPAATILQFSYGLSVPYILPSRSINLSLVFQANYDLPYNLTNFMPVVISAREYVEGTLDLDRQTFYKYLVEVLEGVGLEGETCLLRAICEIAEIPMHIGAKNTLLEEIVHYALTPSLDVRRDNAFLNGNATITFADKLLIAEDMGRSNQNCRKLYSTCLISIVDLFTNKYLI